MNFKVEKFGGVPTWKVTTNKPRKETAGSNKEEFLEDMLQEWEVNGTSSGSLQKHRININYLCLFVSQLYK